MAAGLLSGDSLSPAVAGIIGGLRPWIVAEGGRESLEILGERFRGRRVAKIPSSARPLAR